MPRRELVTITTVLTPILRLHPIIIDRLTNEIVINIVDIDPAALVSFRVGTDVEESHILSSSRRHSSNRIRSEQRPNRKDQVGNHDPRPKGRASQANVFICIQSRLSLLQENLLHIERSTAEHIETEIQQAKKKEELHASFNALMDEMYAANAAIPIALQQLDDVQTEVIETKTAALNKSKGLEELIEKQEQ